MLRGKTRKNKMSRPAREYQTRPRHNAQIDGDSLFARAALAATRSRCSRCNEVGHTTRECHHRAYAAGELDGAYCAQCYEIPERRPAVGLCACERVPGAMRGPREAVVDREVTLVQSSAGWV
jgi:hypothetical protein